jgi:hypothetical protein
MNDHGERPAGAIRRVGPGEKARIAGDGMPGEGDTEGHVRTIHVGPGEHLVDGDGTPADPGEDKDTEGHVALR